ncbi:17054_t:CDS:1, partial [Cetraspora pellucida]
MSTQNLSNSEPSFSCDNPYVKNHYEKKQTDETANSETATQEHISDNKEIILSDADLEIDNNQKLDTANNRIVTDNNTTNINDTNNIKTEAAEAIEAS